MAESLAIIAVLLAILGLLDWILTESQKAAFSVWTLWLWDKLDDLRKRFFKEWGVGRQFRKIYWSVLIPLFLFDFAEWIYHILIGHRDFWLATHGFAPEIVGFYAPVLVGYVFVRTISKLGSFLGKISWMALGLCCMGLLVVSAHALQAYLLVIGVRENDPHFSEDWISVFIREIYVQPYSKNMAQRSTIYRYAYHFHHRSSGAPI